MTNKIVNNTAFRNIPDGTDDNMIRKKSSRHAKLKWNLQDIDQIIGYFKNTLWDAPITGCQVEMICFAVWMIGPMDSRSNLIRIEKGTEDSIGNEYGYHLRMTIKTQSLHICPVWNEKDASILKEGHVSSFNYLFLLQICRVCATQHRWNLDATHIGES